MKCATCQSECTLRPGLDSSQQLSRLAQIYAATKNAKTVMLSKQADEETRERAVERLSACLVNVPMVALRFGFLEVDGERVKIPESVNL